MGVFIEIEKAAVNTEKAVKEMAHGVEQLALKALRQGEKIIQSPASFLPQFAEQLRQYGLVRRHDQVQLLLKPGIRAAD